MTRFFNLCLSKVQPSFRQELDRFGEKIEDSRIFLDLPVLKKEEEFESLYIKNGNQKINFETTSFLIDKNLRSDFAFGLLPLYF